MIVPRFPLKQEGGPSWLLGCPPDTTTVSGYMWVVSMAISSASFLSPRFRGTTSARRKREEVESLLGLQTRFCWMPACDRLVAARYNCVVGCSGCESQCTRGDSLICSNLFKLSASSARFLYSTTTFPFIPKCPSPQKWEQWKPYSPAFEA
jgi:hypothetical protein